MCADDNDQHHPIHEHLISEGKERNISLHIHACIIDTFVDKSVLFIFTNFVAKVFTVLTLVKVSYATFVSSFLVSDFALFNFYMHLP